MNLPLLLSFLAVLALLAWPLGHWLTRVAEGRLPGWLSPLVRAERAFYRLAGVDPDASMGWKAYMVAILAFNLLGVLALLALQWAQKGLPLNPEGLDNLSWHLALNTAISFVTNTNWQSYAGESTMSHLTQMLGLAVQNFLSAATGVAVVWALVRGLRARATGLLGNAWADLTRVTLYVLVPLSVAVALFFVSQGSIQNFSGHVQARTLDTVTFDAPRLDAQGQPILGADGQPLTVAAQTQEQGLPMGPVASQEAIKLLGTNGGGFFNANSAHPYENPTALSNFVQMLAIFLIPAALCVSFGQMVGDLRQGLAVVAAMTVLFMAATLAVMKAEGMPHPQLAAMGVSVSASPDLPGGNLEGKELRFGPDETALFAAVTTSASCGAVNGMHDSFTPLGGLVPMFLMQLGEVVFGGVGSGLYGMLVFAILAVFIAGLMIGRTPEYLGKKIEAFDMKMVSLAILVTPTLVLGGTAVAVLCADGLAGLSNPGAHGFSQVLYAMTSAANNNGSAFAGLSANTPFYNVLLAVLMAVGRFGVIVPILAMAGSLAAKKRLEAGAGTMPTHGPLFIVLLIGTVLIVGALTYIPALALGPIVEHLQLFAGAH